MALISINGGGVERHTRQMCSQRLPQRIVHAEVIASDDPEDALRRHLGETQRLADRLLRLEEDLVIATESGFLEHPQAAIKAIREIESTRYSVAGDIRETAIALDQIILDRYRADYPEPSKDRLRLVDGKSER